MPVVNYYEIDGTDLHVRHVDRDTGFIPRVGDVVSFSRYPSAKLKRKNPDEYKRLSQSADYPKIQTEVVAVEHQFFMQDDERSTFSVEVHVKSISADEWGDRNEALGYQRGDGTLSKPFRDVLNDAKGKSARGDD